MSNQRTAFVVATFLAACTNSALAQSDKCPFTYNDKVRDELVIPTLRAKEGSLSKLYDLERPGIVIGKERVELIFGQTDISVIDSPNFIVVIDPCRSRVISAGETTPGLITDAPKK